MLKLDHRLADSCYRHSLMKGRHLNFYCIKLHCSIASNLWLDIRFASHVETLLSCYTSSRPHILPSAESLPFRQPFPLTSRISSHALCRREWFSTCSGKDRPVSWSAASTCKSLIEWDTWCEATCDAACSKLKSTSCTFLTMRKSRTSSPPKSYSMLRSEQMIQPELQPSCTSSRLSDRGEAMNTTPCQRCDKKAFHILKEASGMLEARTLELQKCEWVCLALLNLSLFSIQKTICVCARRNISSFLVDTWRTACSAICHQSSINWQSRVQPVKAETWYLCQTSAAMSFARSKRTVAR